MRHKPTKKQLGRPPKHAAYSYMTRLTLPDNRIYLRPYLSGVREGLICDLGPNEKDLTTAQKLLIDRAVGITGVIRLIEEFCRENGIFEGKALAPVLSANYGVFVNNLRMILLALGINTRASERILSPLELAAEVDAENAVLAGENRPIADKSPEDPPDTTGDPDDVLKGGDFRPEREKQGSEPDQVGRRGQGQSRP